MTRTLVCGEENQVAFSISFARWSSWNRVESTAGGGELPQRGLASPYVHVVELADELLSAAALDGVGLGATRSGAASAVVQAG
ncbi:hypothetical protein AB0M29_03270 [Streptomyces sp. NPDC051976]|uniref:hypothetical protein n=1 Tax=Streptomyces sp. NPDC051976 TaxID=3154947 RepID=UPI0034200F26